MINFKDRVNGLLYKEDLSESIFDSNVKISTRALFNVQEFQINSNIVKVALPVTFTPYASSRACSARCRFCSENLILKKPGTIGQSLRPPEGYHDQLLETLLTLKQIPMGISLSGLEISDDPLWLLKTIDVLMNWEELGGAWTERAAYTNGSGFATEDCYKLIDALSRLKIDRLEVSRHHFLEDINQKLMRFKDSYKIKAGTVFEKTLKRLIDSGLPITLICILQKKGVNSLSEIEEYLSWSRNLGVRKVIFRELCELPEIYRGNSTLEFIKSQRVKIKNYVENWLSKEIKFSHFVNGYYFWNAVFLYKGQEVVFERSDYSLMKEMHSSDTIYKFVYFANGNLSNDWDPDKVVLGK